ncbi:hypothetical protein I547_5346 [Mycobacterium kansasii 824]|nr:hypothetical protein I547_5346 [Mycobacterium kansasii 824]
MVSPSLAGATSVISVRDTGSPSLGGTVDPAGCGGGLHDAASRTSVGRVRATVHAAAVAIASRITTTIAGRGLRRRNGRPCLSKAVPSVICATTRAL